eukprot:TRINITY_DN7107_c0_g1_i2.p1 TRINITY_DN7107_c0_g1~~TRINITY_DN7107_c0_g1_i2.p1  ORF type:complete len:483 (-),score=105.17 TRINITY_DN7107_c0_g1_i2:50-1498(-)
MESKGSAIKKSSSGNGTGSSHLWDLLSEDTRTLFKEYDLNNDGFITVDEILEVFKKKGHNVDEKQVKQLFAFADTNGDEKISVDEFSDAIHLCLQVKEKFQRLDLDHTDHLDVKEVKQYLRDHYKLANDEKEYDKIFEKMDLDHDGRISFNEFARFWFDYKKAGVRPNYNSDAFLQWIYISSSLPISNGMIDLGQIKSKFDIWPVRMALGGIACGTATVFTNPVDVLKTRMQLNASRSTGGLSTALFSVLREPGGIFNLWNGLSAALLRAASYSSTRLAFYATMKDLIEGVLGKGAPGTLGDLGRKALAGCASGSIAATIANPIEVVKVRMQANKAKYPSTISTFKSLLAEEGIKGIFAGLIPHVLRGAAITSSQISTYDHIKGWFIRRGLMKEGLNVHFVSSMIAGVITTTCSSPFDVVKTRMMINKGQSAWVAIGNVWSEGGPRAFFRGWLPNYGRLGPHTVITLVVFEQLRHVLGLKPV